MRSGNTALGLALALLLAGCRATFEDAGEVREALGPQAVVIAVPYVKQQQAQGCGLACLVSLLRFHGMDVDDEALRRFPEARLEKEPIAAGELRDYLRGRGLRAALVHGSLDHSYPAGLFELLDRGLPVVVEIATKLERHYELACGYDPERKVVLFMDPALGIVGINDDDFERCWRHADHLMLVAAPRAKDGS